MQTDLAQTHLSQLVGAQLTGTGRAANLQHFTFLVADDRTFHLHLECPWRLTEGSQILGGAADYWRASRSDVTEEALDAGEIGATLRDIRNETLRQRIADGLRVSSATVDGFGGFLLVLGSLHIETFPDASSTAHDEWEFWRLFPHGGPHFVVTTNGAYIST